MTCSLAPRLEAFKVSTLSLCTQFPNVLAGISQFSDSGTSTLGNFLLVLFGSSSFPYIFFLFLLFLLILNSCQSNVGPSGLNLNYFLCYFYFFVFCHFLVEYLDYFSTFLVIFYFYFAVISLVFKFFLVPFCSILSSF